MDVTIEAGAHADEELPMVESWSLLDVMVSVRLVDLTHVVRGEMIGSRARRKLERRRLGKALIPK
jgi:hypothetical protein